MQRAKYSGKGCLSVDTRDRPFREPCAMLGIGKSHKYHQRGTGNTTLDAPKVTLSRTPSPRRPVPRDSFNRNKENKDSENETEETQIRVDKETRTHFLY